MHVDDLNHAHMNEILTKKILMPIPTISEGLKTMDVINPIVLQKPISIETALIFGETDRFYKVVNGDVA